MIQMPSIYLKTSNFTVTLEESATGAADDSNWNHLHVPLDLPAWEVTGVFVAADGSGVNFYTSALYPSSTCDGNRVILSAAAGAAIGAATAVWVTYMVEPRLEWCGVPNQRGGVGAVVTPLNVVANSAPATDYELANFTAGGVTILVGFIPPVPTVITAIRVVSDGTNFAVGLFEAATATRVNTMFISPDINLFWLSGDDYPNLEIPINVVNGVYMAIVDTGADSTPANTFVRMYGHPLI